MSRICDMIKRIEALAPRELAQDWDNPGLLIGDPAREVHTVLVALDFDSYTLHEAKTCGAELVVTHHPVIMQPLRHITSPLLLEAIEGRIGVYAAHTNLDAAKNGVNAALARAVGLQQAEQIVLDGFPTYGGQVPRCTLQQLLRQVKDGLGVEALRYVGRPDAEAERVCVLGGSGGDFIPAAAAAGFDVFITADIKYHQAQTAEELGLCVIDGGHFETERPVLQVLADQIRQDGTEVLLSGRTTSYIKYE